MIKYEQKLLAVNRAKYTHASNPLRSHGPDHHWRVYQNAVALADRVGAKYDSDVLAGAALLHDISAYYPELGSDDGHGHDDRLAVEILREINFPPAKIETTLAAIANHGSDPKYKQANEPIETMLLRDADKLDAFGPIGVARITMVRTLRGDSLDDMVSDFLTHGHLQRKWDSITTAEARELGKADFEYSLKFFERLAESLKN